MRLRFVFQFMRQSAAHVVTRAAVLLGMWSVLATSAIARAQTPDSGDRSPHSEITLVSGVDRATPGSTVTVGIRITLDEHWHTYWVNGGDAGLPLSVAWTLPTGVTAGPLRLPTPRLLPQRPLMSYGYERELVALVDLAIAGTVSTTTPLTISAEADWLACADVCLPAAGTASLSLPVDLVTMARPTAEAPRIDAARMQLPLERPSVRATVWVTKTSLLVAIRDTMPRAAAVAPYLFPDSSGVIDHAAVQRVARAGDTTWLEIRRARFGPDTLRAFSGVLSADATRHDATAWHLSATILRDDASPEARARGDALLAATTADTTGGLALAEAGAQRFALAAGTGGPPSSGLTLWAAVGLALLGGLILNLMPCVFPVLSLKVLSFVERGAGDPSIARKHALVFAGGVVATFWALAAALLLLRAGGASVGWGFQLQSPIVVALLAMLVFGLGLNLAGVFDVGMSLTRLGAVGQGESYRDSFLTGALAVVVATPCTAPFMGAALGYALVQPAAVGFAVFTSLAAGLALPYVLLAWSPPLMRRLPRPGPWLETFKQVLAFPLFATAVWLLWVFGQQTGINAMALLLLALTTLSLGAWLWGRASGRVGRSGAAAVMTLSVVVAVVIGGDVPAGGRTVVNPAASPVSGAAGVASDGPNTPDRWEDFTPARLAAARVTGRPVLVDFTAAWCLSCQVNERVALRTETVQQALTSANVILLRADWTSRNADIATVIASYGRSGIPLYVLYPADGARPPELLPTVLTSGNVLDALRRAVGPQSSL